MKKILILVLEVLVLCIGVSTFAFAEDLGLEAGAEMGFGDVADETVIRISPFVTYSKTIDPLEFYLKAQYTAAFEDPDTLHSLYLEPDIIYSFPVGLGSVAVELYGEDTFYIDPSDDMEGMIEPSIQYSQGFSFGELYAKFGLPITYEPDTATDFYGTLGYDRSGFNLEFSTYYNMDPDTEIMGYELFLSYEQDLFYLELAIDTDKHIELFTLSPYGELYIDRFILWAGVDIGNLGDTDLDETVSPYVGCSYTF